MPATQTCTVVNSLRFDVALPGQPGNALLTFGGEVECNVSDLNVPIRFVLPEANDLVHRPIHIRRGVIAADGCTDPMVAGWRAWCLGRSGPDDWHSAVPTRRSHGERQRSGDRIDRDSVRKLGVGVPPPIPLVCARQASWVVSSVRESIDG
jgi:hypothetical protein